MALSPDAVSALYTSDVTTSLNIHKPEKLVELYKARGDQGAQFFLLLETLGWSKPVAQDTYSHFEDMKIHEIFHVKAEVAAAGAGNAALITLAVRDLDAGNRYYPQVGDQVLFPNEVYARIQSIDVSAPTAPVLTVAPNDVTDDIGLLAANSEVIIASNSYAEGGGQPASRFRGMLEYDNDAQIFKSTIGASGSELTRDLWVQAWSDGGRFLGWYNATRDLDITYRHTLAISNALLAGKRNTNTTVVLDTDTESTGDILTTEGLIPVTRRRGTTMSKADGALVYTDFDTLDRSMSKQYASSQVLLAAGKKRYQNMENMLFALNANTNIEYTREVMVNTLFGGDKGKAMAINFASFAKSNRTWYLHELVDFQNPQTLGAAGFKYENMAIAIPVSKKPDLKTKEMIPAIGIRYRMLGDYNRRNEIWKDGAAGPGFKIGQLDKTKTYMRSHLGGQFRGVNQFVLIYEP